MTKIEALQMCLEYIETDAHERKYVRHAIKAALEQPVQEPVACRFCHDKKGCWAWQCYHCGEIDDVQQPAPLPPAIGDIRGLKHQIHALEGEVLGYKKILDAQPVQEPVALRDALANALGGVFGCSRTWSAWNVGTMSQIDFYPAAESDELLDELVQAVAAATPPLPVQRKPLTDEEIQSIWDVAAGAIPGWSRHIAYARAIEAAHNIGGAKP